MWKQNGPARTSTGITLTMLTPSAHTAAPTFEFTAATAAEFERALSCAVTTESDSMCALEAAVTECARELEASGATPEAMLVRIKIEFRAVARKHTPTTGPTMRIEDHVLAKVVRWAIVAYFDAAAAQTA
jgi:hypothetical protein